MKATTSGPANGGRRTNTTLAAFMVGLPLAAAVLAGVRYGAEHVDALKEQGHYVSNPVECVEVVLFCCAIGALAAKVLRNRVERRACRIDVLPPWDGRPVPPAEAPKLLAAVRKQPRRILNTFLGQRVAAVLEFLYQRGAADELDDQMRTLADNDVVSMEGGFALTRFITWAIPILGFLGTVLGITTAIHGATPEVLEKSLSTVTDGLSYAFDATALALALTMITMFLSFLVERDEQGVLDAVDRYVDRCLAHRFQRVGADAAPFVQAVRENDQALMESVGGLVRHQAELWAQTVTALDRRSEEAHARPREQLIGAVETALEKTLDTHARRLAALESKTTEQTTKLVQQMAALAAAVRDTGREQQAALVRVAEGVSAQAGAIGRLQEGENNLVHLQAVLHQNLAARASAGNFEQAVHSLTAAAHLLTARTARPRRPSGWGKPRETPTPSHLGMPLMRSRRHKLQVSTFPVLAVLLCAMGALLLVLLVMDRRAHDAARARAAQAVRRAAEEAARDAEAHRSAFERRRQEARAARQRERDAAHTRLAGQEAEVQGDPAVRDELARAAERLRAEQDDEAALKQKIEAEHVRAEVEEQAILLVRGDAAKNAAQAEASRKEREQMTADLARLERALADLKAAREREQKTYSVVPYNGKHGDNRQPIYVECAAGRVVFYPDRTPLEEPVNASAVRAGGRAPAGRGRRRGCRPPRLPRSRRTSCCWCGRTASSATTASGRRCRVSRSISDTNSWTGIGCWTSPPTTRTPRRRRGPPRPSRPRPTPRHPRRRAGPRPGCTACLQARPRGGPGRAEPGRKCGRSPRARHPYLPARMAYSAGGGGLPFPAGSAPPGRAAPRASAPRPGQAVRRCSRPPASRPGRRRRGRQVAPGPIRAADRRTRARPAPGRQARARPASGRPGAGVTGDGPPGAGASGDGPPVPAATGDARPTAAGPGGSSGPAAQKGSPGNAGGSPTPPPLVVASTAGSGQPAAPGGAGPAPDEPPPAPGGTGSVPRSSTAGSWAAQSGQAAARFDRPRRPGGQAVRFGGSRSEPGILPGAAPGRRRQDPAVRSNGRGFRRDGRRGRRGPRQPGRRPGPSGATLAAAAEQDAPTRAAAARPSERRPRLDHLHRMQAGGRGDLSDAAVGARGGAESAVGQQPTAARDPADDRPQAGVCAARRDAVPAGSALPGAAGGRADVSPRLPDAGRLGRPENVPKPRPLRRRFGHCHRDINSSASDDPASGRRKPAGRRWFTHQPASRRPLAREE